MEFEYDIRERVKSLKSFFVSNACAGTVQIGWNIVIILNITPKSLLSGLIQFSILHAADEKGIVFVIIVLSAHDWVNNLHSWSNNKLTLSKPQGL